MVVQVLHQPQKQPCMLSPPAPFPYPWSTQHPRSLPAPPPALALAQPSHPAHPAGIHSGYTPALEAHNLSSHWLPPRPLHISTSCLIQLRQPPLTQALPCQSPLPSSCRPNPSQRSTSFITQTWNTRRHLPHVRTNASFISTAAFITTFPRGSIRRHNSIAWLKGPTLAYSMGGT